MCPYMIQSGASTISVTSVPAALVGNSRLIGQHFWRRTSRKPVKRRLQFLRRQEKRTPSNCNNYHHVLLPLPALLIKRLQALYRNPRLHAMLTLPASLRREPLIHFYGFPFRLGASSLCRKRDRSLGGCGHTLHSEASAAGAFAAGRKKIRPFSLSLLPNAYLCARIGVANRCCSHRRLRRQKPRGTTRATGASGGNLELPTSTEIEGAEHIIQLTPSTYWSTEEYRGGRMRTSGQGDKEARSNVVLKMVTTLLAVGKMNITEGRREFKVDRT